MNGPIVPAQDNEPVPAWAAVLMSNNALWAGRWAGCSDGLARLLRRYAEDSEVAHALQAYEQLRAWFENPVRVLGPEGPLHNHDAKGIYPNCPACGTAGIAPREPRG